jgi:hypothetical protein
MAWAPDYITDDQLKGYQQIVDDVDDAEIAWAITTASRAIDEACGRQFGLVALVEQRRYTPRWSSARGRWVVSVDDFQTVTGLLVHLVDHDDEDVQDLVSGTVRKLPFNATAEGRPWEKLVLPADLAMFGDEGEVAVTARWGWTTVPVAIEQATALQAARFLARRSAPFGVAGSPDTGSEMRLLAKVDPDVKVSVGTYERHELVVF